MWAGRHDLRKVWRCKSTLHPCTDNPPFVMKRLFLICTAALFFGVGNAYAQLPPTPKVYIGGGASMPNAPASFSDSYRTGPNVTVGIGLPLFPFTEGVLAARYDRFGLDGAYTGFSVDGGTLSVLSGSLNLKINPPLPAPISPYAIGGVGVYRSTVGEVTVSGTGGSLSLGLEGDTNLGANLGVGLTFDLMPLVDLYIEPQYVIVFSEGEDMKYYPIRAGLAIGL